MLDDLPIGSVFEPGRLHITIIPWFVVDVDETEVIQSFYREFSANQPLKVKVGKNNTDFGPNHDVRVSLIEPNEEIFDLHKQAVGWFGAINARWAVKKPHVGEEFIPHIRRRQGTKLDTGENIHVSSLSLIAADRQEDSLRRVAAKVEFDR